jgi:hypothetical protein
MTQPTHLVLAEVRTERNPTPLGAVSTELIPRDPGEIPA